jgi:hypothetical protein
MFAKSFLSCFALERRSCLFLLGFGECSFGLPKSVSGWLDFN